MKFFLISNMYPTIKFPGYGSFVKNICDELGNNNFHKTLVSVIRGRGKNKLSKLRKYLMFYLSITINFFKKYSFIYIHFPNQAILMLNILYKFKRPPIIVNFHGEDLLFPDSGIGNILGKMTESFCKKYVSAVVVPSEYFKQIVIQKRIAKPEKVIVSPSGGINSSHFYPNQTKDLDLTSRPIHLGYVGRLEEGKGIREFLDTCIEIKKLGMDYKGTIIGYGSLSEYVYKIVEENLKDRVSIIDGMSQKELGDYYRIFDLLIFSSSRPSESLGLTGIEAMACGTPVIGSDIGGISSYLIDNINGLAVPQKDIKSIVKAIEKYINLSLLQKKRLSINAVQTGKKYYSDIVAKQLALDINNCLSQ